MSTRTDVVLTTREIIELRARGWSAGWIAADCWRDAHIDAALAGRAQRMPDWTRGTIEVGHFLSGLPLLDTDDTETGDLAQAYRVACCDIVDAAAEAAWNTFRDQHCDEHNCLVVDDYDETN